MHARDVMTSPVITVKPTSTVKETAKLFLERRISAAPVVDCASASSAGSSTFPSINGQKGQFGQVNYSASKAGEIGFTKALAQEGARAGITVNATCPGYSATDMVKAMSPEVLSEKVLPQIPIGRLGKPEEIARCVVFLAADDAGLITGSTLTANSGRYFA
jgi:NAD(P)-dependent dehydrogenase (short-subunit alcohol dehydrogenase family)